MEIECLYLQSQAQECVFEKLILSGVDSGMDNYAAVAQDAAKVHEPVVCFEITP